MSEIQRLLAVDLGASSGRVMLGSYDGSTIQIEEIHRFDNTPVQVQGHLHWDVLRLFHEIKQGVREAARVYGKLLSLSVDTWGVDYGFIDHRGQLLYAPHHYRDQRTVPHRSGLEERLPPREQFALTGNQPALINTVYQLYADLQDNPSLAESARTMLLTPDLFHYLFSGVAAAEKCIWSTSGLADAVTGEPSHEVFKTLDLPISLIPELVAEAGTVLGEVTPAIQEELGLGAMKVIAGASHDTASAVASIPYADKDGAAFISCGTWSLVGRESEGPVITDQSYAYGFTNEGCYGGTNRVLKNITGLWILQESQRHWAASGQRIGHAELAELAAEAGPAVAIIDPDDPLFSTPGDMPQRIVEYCRRTQQQEPHTPGETARVIVESLAHTYSCAIDDLEEITGRPVRVIHMVGGGIQNRLLCQLTADRTGREVIAGPVEASAIGNMVTQLLALGVVELSAVSELIAHSSTLITYQPSNSKNPAR
ncbi:rhamnulokinase family protein [Paenibacillus sp. GCM10012306]|uniref:rhamnulokinase n=1 Tax=Paenibacillus sp. GCM10012306 TaxID=3317342 RepID=UPI0036161519